MAILRINSSTEVTPRGSHSEFRGEHRAVAGRIRSLTVGESAVFPIERRGAAWGAVSRFRTEMARIGWEAVAVTDRKNFTITVTRTK